MKIDAAAQESDLTSELCHYFLELAVCAYAVGNTLYSDQQPRSAARGLGYSSGSACHFSLCCGVGSITDLCLKKAAWLNSG
jgi:hypothetical protein